MIKTILACVAMACVLQGLVASRAASSAFGASATELDQQLDAIDKAAASIADLTADFIQRKHTAMLKKPLESRGTLRVKGAAMRWDTQQPAPSVMTVDSSQLKLYSPRQSLLEVYPIRKGLAQLAASPLPRLALVREHFTIEAADWPSLPEAQRNEHLAIRLTPREKALREHVQEVRVLLNIAAACAVAVQITDPDGDRLDITFDKIRKNSDLSDEDVRFDPPPGTTITHPLEPKPQP